MTLFGNLSRDCLSASRVWLLFAVVVLSHGAASVQAWEYRIDGDTNSGRLLVRPSTTSDWGTVCSDKFTNAGALVACRSVFPTGRILSYSWAKAPNIATFAAVPIYLDDVICTGNETVLSSCSHVDDPNCAHNQDVQLTCSVILDPMELRLSEGTKGLLEVRPNASAPWGTICSVGFTYASAQAVCRELNTQYAYSALALLNVTSADVRPIYRSNVACAGATYFSSCNYTAPNGMCDKDTNAGVICTDWEFKIDSSSGLVGRLLARPLRTAAWGTVCAAGFTSVAARVACRTVMPVGYELLSASVATAGSTSNYSSLKPLMSNVNCPNETVASLAACSWLAPACTSRNLDAVLTCTVDRTSVRLSNGTSGIVTTRVNAAAPWGAICSDGFDDADAAAVCRELNYRPPQYLASAVVNGTYNLSEPVNFSNVRCNSTQLFSTCPRDLTASAACTSGSNYSLATVRCESAPAVWEFQLMDTTISGDYGIYGYAHRGRLGVRPNAWSSWGTVCRDFFATPDALVACRSVFPNRTILAVQFASANSATGYPTSYPILMDDVNCNGTEQRLNQCTYTGSHNCAHANDVILTCVVARNSTVEYRLAASPAGPSSPKRGVLQTRPNATAPWGAVCDNGFAPTRRSWRVSA
jgi:hypothetical protein